MASRIKIKVIDKESNFRLWLPAIPFWLFTSLSSLALKFISKAPINGDDKNEKSWQRTVLSSIPMTSCYSDELCDGANLAIEQIDKKKLKKLIKEFVRELRQHGRFDLVDISTGDGTIVKISIL